MRLHATFLVLYNSRHISPLLSTNLRHHFPSAIMPTHKQQRNQNYPSSESGEEFSDVGPTLDSDDDESVVQTQDNWTFPVVSSKAKREEYESASKFHCRILLTKSEIVFRLLKVRKSRLANFKIK